MKYNLDVVIDGVIEQHTHGVIEYKEVKLSCYRGTGDSLIAQDDNEILLEHGQVEQLYKHLKNIFGE